MEEIINVKIIEETTLVFEILPYIVSVLCAVIAGLASWLVTHKQTKSAINELDQKYKLDLEQYKAQDLYETRKKVIFKALTLFDDYISWLTIDGEKPVRKQDCSNADFTFLAREVYNELCVTVENQRLIELFNEIFFGYSPYFLGKVAEFRKESRKELGLTNIEFPESTAFISKVSAEDLMMKEKQTIVKLRYKRCRCCMIPK